jgi:predicted nuclease with TOPRIM domain
LGFKTVEQLANATDEAKRKLGPLSKFCKLAKDWMDAAKSDQNEVVKLRQLLEREQAKTDDLRHKLELLMQRVEANEGISLRAERKEVIRSIPDEALEEGIIEAQDENDAAPRRGRPRKI